MGPGKTTLAKYWPVISLGSILGGFHLTIPPPPQPEGRRRGVTNAIYITIVRFMRERRTVDHARPQGSCQHSVQCSMFNVQRSTFLSSFQLRFQSNVLIVSRHARVSILYVTHTSSIDVSGLTTILLIYSNNCGGYQDLCMIVQRRCSVALRTDRDHSRYSSFKYSHCRDD